jgi:hypothetical protein
MATITDLFLEARRSVDATTTSYTDADLLRRINMAWGEVEADLIALDRKNLFGDTNNTTLSEDLQTMTAATHEYAFDSALLSLFGVSVLDADSIWHKLDLIDEMEILASGTDLAEYEKTDGLPWGYAKREKYIVLYPAPATASVTLTNGLKTYYQKIGTLFTSADIATGTKEPGFDSPFHYILSYKAALPFAAQYKPDRLNWLLSEVKRIHDAMINSYCNKFKDEKPRMTMRGISSI